MTSVRIHLRLAGDPSGQWRAVDLPPPSEAGLQAASWSEASVSTALAWVQRNRDPSLTALLSCRRGLCNVCAVRIDGKVSTACTTPVRDGMRIEPAKDALALSGMAVNVSWVRRARL